MSVNVKPLADRVIVEPAAAEEKTAGGIIIPDTAKEKPHWGTSGVPFINKLTLLSLFDILIEYLLANELFRKYTSIGGSPINKKSFIFS